MFDSEKNARAILGRNVDRAISRGEVRPHEREHAIDVARTLWTGQKGNGRAVDEAVALVKRGQA